MSDDQKAVCGLCGEPMPEGEEMFNYHGFSGPCPKSPKEASWPLVKLPPNTLHRCTACGCLWRRWLKNESFSLAAGQKPCKRCDNSPEFVSLLDPPPVQEIRELSDGANEIANDIVEWWFAAPVALGGPDDLREKIAQAITENADALRRELQETDALISIRMRPTDLATDEQRRVYDAARNRHKNRSAGGTGDDRGN